MLGYGARADVGVVGALLVDGARTVQHAGLIIGLDGPVAIAYRDAPFKGCYSGRNPGLDGSLLASREVSAVSAVCMLTRADVFDRLNGFDEQFAHALHDADYCLRARELGYKTILDVYAILGYAGGRGKGVLDVAPTPEETARFNDRYKELMTAGDPFFSPFLSRLSSAPGWSALSIAGQKTKPRTVRVNLPTSGKSTQDRRWQAHPEKSSYLHVSIGPGADALERGTQDSAARGTGTPATRS